VGVDLLLLASSFEQDLPYVIQAINSAVDGHVDVPL
jgi:hypothetical protein